MATVTAFETHRHSLGVVRLDLELPDCIAGILEELHPRLPPFRCKFSFDATLLGRSIEPAADEASRLRFLTTMTDGLARVCPVRTGDRIPSSERFPPLRRTS